MGAEFYDRGVPEWEIRGSSHNRNQPDNHAVRVLHGWLEMGDVLLPSLDAPLALAEPETVPGLRSNPQGQLKLEQTPMVRATRNPYHAIFQATFYLRSLEEPFRGHAASRPLRASRPMSQPPVGIELFLSYALLEHVENLESVAGEPVSYVHRLSAEHFAHITEGYASYSKERVQVLGTLAVGVADLGDFWISCRDTLDDEGVTSFYQQQGGIREPEINALQSGEARRTGQLPSLWEISAREALVWEVQQQGGY